jgi:hypothetical protein
LKALLAPPPDLETAEVVADAIVSSFEDIQICSHLTDDREQGRDEHASFICQLFEVKASKS